MDSATNDDVVLVLELEPASGGHRWRWIGGIAAVAVVLVGVVGLSLLGRGSDGNEPEVIEIEQASAPVTSTPATAVAAEQPTTTDAESIDGGVPATATTRPHPSGGSVGAEDGDDEVVADPAVPVPAELPTTSTTAAPRFRIVPGSPPPPGSSMSSFVAGEAYQGSGGALFGTFNYALYDPDHPGGYSAIAPEFVPMSDESGNLCGYVRVEDLDHRTREFDLPMYDTDGVTIVAWHLSFTSEPGYGCVPAAEYHGAGLGH